MERTNEQWTADLRAEGRPRDAALADLRSALLRGLRGALGGLGTGEAELLEDVTQDAILRILDRLESFEGKSRFLTWATAIAVRLALTELRRRRWKDVSLEELTEKGSVRLHRVTDHESAAERRLDRESILRTLQELMERALTQRQREVLLAKLGGMPQEEIARRMGSKRNAIYKVAHDARKRLQKGLEEAGYPEADIRQVFGF